MWGGGESEAGEAEQRRAGTQGDFPSLSVCHGTKLPPYLAKKHLHDDCTAQHGDNPWPHSLGGRDGDCGDELAVVAGMWQSLTRCRRAPQPMPGVPQPRRVQGRYLCHFSLPIHLSSPEPPENQLSAAGCYKPGTGVPGQHARPMLADHMLLVSASPLPAPSVCKLTVGNRVAGHLPLLCRWVTVIARRQVGPGALYGLWASF